MPCQMYSVHLTSRTESWGIVIAEWITLGLSFFLTPPALSLLNIKITCLGDSYDSTQATRLELRGQKFQAQSFHVAIVKISRGLSCVKWDKLKGCFLCCLKTHCQGHGAPETIRRFMRAWRCFSFLWVKDQVILVVSPGAWIIKTQET